MAGLAKLRNMAVGKVAALLDLSHDAAGEITRGLTTPRLVRLLDVVQARIESGTDARTAMQCNAYRLYTFAGCGVRKLDLWRVDTPGGPKYQGDDWYAVETENGVAHVRFHHDDYSVEGSVVNCAGFALGVVVAHRHGGGLELYAVGCNKSGKSAWDLLALKPQDVCNL